MEFTDLNIHAAYETGIDDLIMDFYVPMLANAKRYDRIAGFFSSTSLALAARGIAGLIANDGIMRIVASPRLSKEDVEIINGSIQDPETLIVNCLLKGIDGRNIEDQFCRDHVSALGWMLANNRLEMQIAVVTDPFGHFTTEQYLVHQKVGIFYDREFNAVSFSGSNNETASGWLGNVEEFKTFKSWEIGQQPYLESDRRIFDQVGKTFGSFEKDGYQYIGGKYLAVRLFEGKHIKADENKQDGDFTRYGTLIDGAKDKATKTINVPSLADLKLYEKMFKIEHENMYTRLEKVAVYLLDNYYPVNTKFLIDIITIIGDENLEIHVVDGSPVSPIYIRSEDGDAIILPIRLSEADRQVLAA